MAKKVKRRKPRKRALTELHVRQAIQRYDRLVGEGLAKIAQLVKRVDKYRRRLQYYQQRADAMAAERTRLAQQAAERAEAAAGRALRNVDLDQATP